MTSRRRFTAALLGFAASLVGLTGARAEEPGGGCYELNEHSCKCGPLKDGCEGTAEWNGETCAPTYKCADTCEEQGKTYSFEHCSWKKV